ncbi:MAG: NAD-dependent epimerase/dehydratase family protein [Candidatus Binatia bacterium]
MVVTGGAGFIGSHIVDAYIAEGHEVVVIDDFSTGSKQNLNRKAKLYSLGLLDPKLPDLFSEISPDVLSHHAAQMDLRRSVTDPLFDARVNILGLIHLLEASRTSAVKRVIFASSGGAVYGEQESFPAPEKHPTQPMSPYGVSKLAGEYYLAYYQQAFGIPYVALRYSNVYGPRQNSMGEAGVVAIFIRQLLEGKSPTINGDGKQSRDYVYVEDVVAANLSALNSSYVGPLNIGTGRETDVLTLFQKLRKTVGSKIKAIHGPAKTGEQRRSCLETSRAREVLGWIPQTPLEAGLDKTVDYYRQAGLA